MMRWNRICLILGWLILMALFQNMSLLEPDQIPRKPAGYLENPWSQYFSNQPQGHSLDDVGRGFLCYNLDPWLKQMEVQYLETSTPYFGISLLNAEDISRGEMGSVGSALPSRNRWRVAVVNPQMLKVSWLHKWEDQSELEISCHNERGLLQCGVYQPISRNFQMSVQAGDKLSQLQLNYNW
jgi:hypothetical protein